MSSIAKWLWGACAAALVSPACGTDEKLTTSVPEACEASAGRALQDLPGASVALHWDAASSPATEQDVSRYLGEIWNQSVVVADGAPDAANALSIWFSTSEAARAKLGVSLTDGYVMRRIDDGDHVSFVVYAPDEQNLVHAAYAFLEELGVRFFHPRAELVPHFGDVRVPAALDIERHPAWRIRGIQEHTLHPIEAMSMLNEPSPENLADAKQYIDWLVKTGQNELQWPLMDTVPFSAFAPHAQAIIDYAHSRGVLIGAGVELFSASSLQNNYVLVENSDDWQNELDTKLAELMQVKWDIVELALGEFIGSDPGSIVTWMNHATETLAATHPETELSVSIHVGNYANLWVDYKGKKTFFYHLAGDTDPRLTNNVHTVSFFDLYRPWGTYKHDDFFFQRDYLFGELGERKVRYIPESAYWIGADIDVPQFLPEYIYARWLDVSGLTRDIEAKNLPKLDGHVLFSSGKEWGYWLTDYLTAKMQWDPKISFQDLLGHATGVFGGCSTEIGSDLESLVALQNEYLFDRRLAAYVQGEDNVLDLGYIAGIESHPKRMPFQDVTKLDEGALATFEHDVVDALAQMAQKIRPLEQSLSTRCARADSDLAPWCNELVDGFAIDRLRAEHSAELYRAVIAYARGGSGASQLATAKKITSQAEQVIARREQGYRWPLSRLVDAYQNPTIYEFGYLRQSHTGCFWRRQDVQAEILITEGAPAPFSALPSCVD